jgi:hypothetical protein
MSFEKYLISLADNLDKLNLSTEANLIDSIIGNTSEFKIIKNSCIIASGQFQDKKCLFKNRDRGYKPKVKVCHRVVNGTEIIYLEDKVTDWCEGLNEYGIGVVNTTLDILSDQRQGTEEEDDDISKKPEDKKRMIQALSQKKITEVVRYITMYLNGLEGHNLVANSEVTFAIEEPEDTDTFTVTKLEHEKLLVRTNHKNFFKNIGKSEVDETVDYKSSISRYNQAVKILNKVKEPEKIAPAIYGAKRKDLDDPNNMIKDTDKLSTTSQMVLNLSDLEFCLYLIPNKIDFIAYEVKLPKDYQPKIKFKLFQYSELNKDGSFEVYQIDPPKKIEKM